MQILKFIAVVLVAITMASCQKENIEEIAPKQVVTYNVECSYCLVYIEDNTWNRGNALERSKNQYFNVNGKWKYEFTNKGLDSVRMQISVSVFAPEQKIKASISTNDGRKVEFNDNLGFGKSPFENYEFDKTIELDLR